MTMNEIQFLPLQLIPIIVRNFYLMYQYKRNNVSQLFFSKNLFIKLKYCEHSTKNNIFKKKILITVISAQHTQKFLQNHFFRTSPFLQGYPVTVQVATSGFREGANASLPLSDSTPTDPKGPLLYYFDLSFLVDRP